MTASRPTWPIGKAAPDDRNGAWAAVAVDASERRNGWFAEIRTQIFGIS